MLSISNTQQHFVLSFLFLFFSSLPPNKIIIKQDHVADNFYFIINGSGKSSLAYLQRSLNWHLNLNLMENPSNFEMPLINNTDENRFLVNLSSQVDNSFAY